MIRRHGKLFISDNADVSMLALQAAAAPQQARYTQEQNNMARAFVLANSREMLQVVSTQTLTGTLPGQVVTIPLRNVGLVKRLIVEVTGTVAQTAAETQNLTQWGLANLFSNLNVTDLSNYQRINTTGWHLHAMASLRRQAPYGAAFINDQPLNMGSSFLVQNAPASVTTAKSFRWFYEVPLSYSDIDLRGAIYSAVVNATWQLQFTINPAFFVAAAGDPTLSVYQSSIATLGTLSNVTVTVHQNYLDQLPFVGQNPVLPLFDLATAYMLINTSQVGLAVGQDFPVQYPNFRQILSTMFIYDNNGVLNAGTDINSVAIQVANLTHILKVDPFVLALKTRNTIGDDWPKGSYCVETRMQPINTSAYGNMQLVVNPSSVNAPATLLTAYEMLGIINQVANAGSLAGS